MKLMLVIDQNNTVEAKVGDTADLTANLADFFRCTLYRASRLTDTVDAGIAYVYRDREMNALVTQAIYKGELPDICMPHFNKPIAIVVDLAYVQVRYMNRIHSLGSLLTAERLANPEWVYGLAHVLSTIHLCNNCRNTMAIPVHNEESELISTEYYTVDLLASSHMHNGPKVATV